MQNEAEGGGGRRAERSNVDLRCINKGTPESEYTQAKAKTKQQKEHVESLLNFSKNTNPVVDSISRFSKSTNQLLLFFKGKIKPNLKSIDKSNIQNMLTDMKLLDENFKSVNVDLIHTYQTVFGIDGKYRDKKENKEITYLQ